MILRHKIPYILTLMILWGFQVRGYGQQQPQWTQYILNKYGINPAYAGLDKSLSITSGLRSQWSRLEGAPKTQFVNAHIPLYFLSGSAGMSVLNDQIGALRRTEVALSYNYISDSRYGLISIGFKVGGQQVFLDSDALRFPDGVYVDQTINHRDPIITEVNPTGMSPIWSIGAFYVKNLLEIGLVLDNVPSNTIEAGATTYNSTQNMSLFASYQYPLNELVAIEPNFLMKSDGKQTQLDLGVMSYYQTVFAGVSIRGYNANSLDALGLIVGTELSKKVRLSYSFDLGLSGLQQYQDGSHEFIFNYNLSKSIRTGELPRVIYNPRYR